MAKRVPQVILDSSAVLAVLQVEKGADAVADIVDKAGISAVNATEVLTKLIDSGMNIAQARKTFGLLHLDVESFDAAQANTAAALRGATKNFGLSLGDRACLALGLKLQVPVMTSDLAWSKFDVGIAVKQIR